MVTIHRAHGLRFVIYTQDHEPAHVHVIGDGMLKINIIGPDGLPELIESVNMKAVDRRRAMDIVREQQEAFLARWREIHGGDE